MECTTVQVLSQGLLCHLRIIRLTQILIHLLLVLTEGGMTLYMKAGPDGESVGDCPFAHFVRMVLEEKGLDYEVRPSTQETKPQWLIDYYDGKMPALRHRRECYVESDVIAEYLDFFFPQPPLQGAPKDVMEAAEQAVEGFFPAFAKYAKHTPDGDDQDIELRDNLKETLRKLESHLNKNGPFIAGESISLVDCGLTPKLYHMQTCLAAFKGNSIDIKTEFPKLSVYMDTMFARDSFQKTVYGVDVVEWGWSNARK